jgi:phage/plasmid-like protein (TIGR03299 family)
MQKMAAGILENDNMISANNITPWHKLGEVVEGFGISDLHRIMGWKVEKFKLQTCPYSEYSYDGNEKNVISEMPTDSYATVRMPRNDDENAIVLGSGLSATYKVLQNEQLIKVIEPYVDQGCKLETAGTLFNGRRVWVMLSLGRQILVKGNDLINPYILVSNSHDGRQAAKIGLIAVRVVCQNTLNMAESEKDAQIIRILHHGNIEKNMETVANMLDVTKGRFINYSENLNHLASKGINEKDLRKYVKDCFFGHYTELKATERALRIIKTEEKIIELFESGAGSDLSSAKGTVYGAYQAVNYYLNHNRDIELADRLSSLVWGTRSLNDRKAFNEAMKLAA